MSGHRCAVCSGRRIKREDAFLWRCMDCATPWPNPHDSPLKQTLDLLFATDDDDPEDME